MDSISVEVVHHQLEIVLMFHLLQIMEQEDSTILQMLLQMEIIVKSGGS